MSSLFWITEADTYTDRRIIELTDDNHMLVYTTYLGDNTAKYPLTPPEIELLRSGGCPSYWRPFDPDYAVDVGL